MTHARVLHFILIALAPLFGLSLAAAVHAAAPPSASSVPAPASAATCPVSVRYADPQHFTEARNAARAGALESDRYLDQIKQFLLQRAPRVLHDDQCLHIVITDIDLAGEYEPRLGPRLGDVRIIRDIYPPRIALRFHLYARDGTLQRKGRRNLRGLGVMSSVPPGQHEAVPYEKALLSRWLNRGADKL